MAPMTFNFMEQHPVQHPAQHPDQNLGFINVLPDADAYTLSTHSDSSGMHSQDPGFNLQPYPLDFTGAIDPLTNIEFQDQNHEQVPKHMSHALGRYLAEQQRAAQIEPAESTISDMSNSGGSPESLPPPSFKPAPIVTCSCLSSLYLTMDSLTRVPSDLLSAMRVTRNASKVAYDVINCPYCSNHAMMDDPTIPVPIQSFQNRMYLGALVPTVCNVYVTILEMIDVETAKAREEGRNMWFSLRDVGGLWGSIAEQPDSCPRLHDYDNKAVDPDSWRRTMRAIVRLDVHGLDEIPDDGLPRPRQQGLRDIVRLMDARSNRRHEILDELIASGQVAHHQNTVCAPGLKSLPQEQRACFRILDAARMALDNLVIS
ncbi:hypothetical protein HJFPF1_01061 [Paramyrothecium foliicola]|nr:hypothetical protein HJFPF1_01061 [Paramyrothecium foliicola]